MKKLITKDAVALIVKLAQEDIIIESYVCYSFQITLTLVRPAYARNPNGIEILTTITQEDIDNNGGGEGMALKLLTEDLK